MINYKFRLLTQPVYNLDELKLLEGTIENIRRIAEMTVHTFIFDEEDLEIEAIQTQE